MALDADILTRSVHIEMVHNDGTPRVGTLTFYNSRLGNGEQTVPVDDVIAVLDGTGQATVTLIANLHNPAVSPNGSYWTVIERLDGGYAETRVIQIDYSTPNPVEYDSLLPAVVDPTASTYVTQAELVAAVADAITGAGTVVSVDGENGVVVLTDNYVSLTGANTIAGVKTFSSSPIVPLTPTTTTQAASKGYTDTGLAAKADDSVVVKLTGAQTVAGIKTFSSLPSIPTTPSAAGDATSKSYVDTADALKAADNAVVKLTGAQTVAGIKTFSSLPVIPLTPSATTDAASKGYVDTADATKAADNAVVHLTGAETAAGVKTFSSSPIVPLTPTTTTQAASKGYVDTADALKADDSVVVKLTGAQTVAGVKTFSSLPVIPATPSASTDAASKGYVDSTVSAGAPDASTTVKGIVKLAGDLGGTAALPTVTGLSAKAADSAVVHLTGAETVAGIKTFSSLPVIPLTPSATTDAASKGYVDSVSGGGGAPDASTTVKGIVKLAGDLAGTALLPTVPGLTAKAADSAVVHLTGAETVAGVKTFSSSPIVPAPTTTFQAATKDYADTQASNAIFSAQAYADARTKFAMKTADTNRTSTTTLASDPDLTLSVDSGTTYHVEIGLIFSSDVTPGFKNAMTIPASSTSTLQNSSSVNGYRLTGTTVDTWTIANTTARIIQYRGVLVTTGFTGTYAVQWAQSTSNATAAKMLTGSYMKLERVS